MEASQALIAISSCGSGAVLEAPGLVSGLDDFTVVSEAIEQRGGHLGVAEDCGPFAEGEVGGDDDRGALVETADQVEQQLAAGLRKGKIAQLVEDHEVRAGQVFGHAALLAAAGLGLQPVHQIDDVEEAPAGAVADERPRYGDGQVGLSGSGAADQDDIALIGHKAAGGQLLDQTFVDRGSGEVELFDVLGERQLGDGHLVADGPRLFLGDLGLQQIAHDARAEQRYQMEIRIAFDNKPIIADMERQSLRAQSVVTDAHTREKLRPNVPLGSQRPLYSNDYYPTFNLPHVRLITGAVTRVGERSVSTATETVEDVDTLILATGYKANKFLSVIDVYGRDGLSIHDAWSEGPQAYLGIATSGFPNLFMLYGPNTNNGSIMTMLEYQSDYIIARLRQMLDAGLSWVDIRKSVMDAYNEKLQAEIRAVEPWQAEGSKYYRAASGRIVTQWPHNMEAYEKAVAVDDFDLYEHSAKQGRLATA